MTPPWVLARPPRPDNSDELKYLEKKDFGKVGGGGRGRGRGRDKGRGRARGREKGRVGPSPINGLWKIRMGGGGGRGQGGGEMCKACGAGCVAD